MSKHRSGGRPLPPMSRHRADVRPRWGRIGAVVASCTVVIVALLATIGLLRVSGVPSNAYDPSADVKHAALNTEPTPTPSASPAPLAVPDSGSAQSSSPTGDGSASTAPDSDTALPADSGSGRRAVFSISRQRVWIVDHGDDVKRTYLVSGSVTDNLDPGTYAVYSRSENAVGVDDSGTMKWFVRFAHGDNAAIGFHDIPVKDGRPLQTAAQLGTPESHGCIRQKESDALAMWDFAQIGTKVVVTA